MHGCAIGRRQPKCQMLGNFIIVGPLLATMMYAVIQMDYIWRAIVHCTILEVAFQASTWATVQSSAWTSEEACIGPIGPNISDHIRLTTRSGKGYDWTVSLFTFSAE